MEIVFTDLDGTLKQWEEPFHEDDLATLDELGRRGIVRVIATGRNLYFSRKAIPQDFPIDYLIFSSGAGILRWSDQKLLFVGNIPVKQAQEMSVVLSHRPLNFTIQMEIGREHHCYFRQHHQDPHDFAQRLANYRDFITPLTETESFDASVSQALVVLSEAEAKEDDLAALSSLLPEMKVIRATSPYNKKGVWLEIFRKDISKGAAAKWLCEKLGLEIGKSLGIGNDYNDLDLLKATASSWVVADAPQALREQFCPCPMVEAAFSHAVRRGLEFHRNSC